VSGAPMNKPTPSQTIGPFFHEGLKWAVEPITGIRGAVRIGGRVLDRDARPVNDALIEVWQPAWEIGPRLQRAMSDDDGRFAFLMPVPEHGQGHANVTVFARGLLRSLFTRAYLHARDDSAAIELPDGVPANRGDTLVPRRVGDGYAWDIRLRGEDETVFFEL